MSAGERRLHTSSLAEQVSTLDAGDRVLLSGTGYTARDAAHKRFLALLSGGGTLPFPLEEAVLYYAGPTPGRDGMAVGACGPTTAGRMDPYTPRLLELGLRGMIGKGGRSEEVRRAIAGRGGVYFAAEGGAGALIASHILRSEVVAFEELGCEAVRRLEIRDLPLITAIDSRGRDLFQEGPAAYRQDR